MNLTQTHEGYDRDVHNIEKERFHRAIKTYEKDGETSGILKLCREYFTIIQKHRDFYKQKRIYPDKVLTLNSTVRNIAKVLMDFNATQNPEPLYNQCKNILELIQ